MAIAHRPETGSLSGVYPAGWRIDPGTLSLTNPDAPRRFTAEAWAHQQWPLIGSPPQP